jgi:hypothetical protein
MHTKLKHQVAQASTSGLPRPRGMSSGVTIILKTCRGRCEGRVWGEGGGGVTWSRRMRRRVTST